MWQNTEQNENKYGPHVHYVNNKYTTEPELQTSEQLQTPK